MGHSDNAVISNNTLDSNTASSGGGVFLYYSDHATISGNSFTSNIASTSGGGLDLDHSENITVSQNSVTGNTAGWAGGGILLSESTAVLDGNSVISNTAIGDNGGGIPIGVGGGIAISFSQAKLINTLIADNQVNSAGSGLHVGESFVQVMHATIARNSGGNGSGIYITGDEFMGYSDVVLTNTILVSHTVGVTVREGNTATLEVTLWGNGAWANDTDWGGAGTVHTGTVNIWQDPAFVNPVASDYHLGSGSAAIDAGVNAGVTEDIDGDPRPQYTGYDIGADEVVRTCWARLNDDPTDYTTVQAAVDASTQPTDVVKVAGYCTGVQARTGITQVVYISKTVTVRGGYTITNWTVSDPIVNPTTLDAQGLGRVLVITGTYSAGPGQAITPTVEGLHITGGDATGLGLVPHVLTIPGVRIDAGGGVFVYEATATISDCVVYGNTASTADNGMGGRVVPLRK